MENYETLVEKVVKEQIGDLQDDLRFKCLHDSKIIEDFCERYKVKLVSIGITTENSTPEETIREPVYYFDNNFGPYTKRALEASLKEENFLVLQQ